jgi:hypothetical protein
MPLQRRVLSSVLNINRKEYEVKFDTLQLLSGQVVTDSIDMTTYAANRLLPKK